MGACKVPFAGLADPVVGREVELVLAMTDPATVVAGHQFVDGLHLGKPALGNVAVFLDQGGHETLTYGLGFRDYGLKVFFSVGFEARQGLTN